MDETSNRRWGAIFLWAASLLVTPFALLAIMIAAAYVEFKLAGTTHIEDATERVCKTMRIDEPVGRFVRGIVKYLGL
jgi:hypothetical protein